MAIVFLLLFTVGLGLAGSVRADAPTILHEARLLYHVDRTQVPAWVQHRAVTLRVEVGPALDVVANGDGAAVSCLYDGQVALANTDAEWIELIVAGPERELDAIGAATLAPLYADKDWALSLTLDDGYTSQATTAHALLGRYGYDATIAVVGSYIGRTVSGKSYASAAQLRDVMADGWELSNHSNMHQRAADIGNALDVMRDLRAANVAIAAAVPSYTPFMFTNPFADTDFNAIVEHYTDELGFHLYQTTRWEGRQVDPGVFSFDDLIPYAIGRKAIAADGSQFDEAHGWVTDQPGTHWWLSLHTHYVQPACDCVETATDYLYRTYGAGGSDEVWVAPAPQVFDYLVSRDRSALAETSRSLVGTRPADYALDQTPADQPPVVRTLVLGQPTQDATIHSYKPTYRYGGESGLAVRTVNQASALLQFDLSTLDPRAHVTAAVLRLYGLQGTNPDAETCVQAHRLLTPWDEATTTWREASAGTAWAAYGAAGLGLDRAGELTGLRVLSNGLPGWYALDVTDDVRLLQGAPEANHGWLIAGSGDAAKEVVFASREHPSAAWRPRLEISYTLPQTPEPGPPGSAGLALRLAGWSGVFDFAEPPRVVTITLDAAASYSYVLTRPVGVEGRLLVDGLAAGSYDVRVELAGALPMVREGVAATVGGPEVALGPLVVGDISGDRLVGARDWQLLSAAIVTDTVAGAADEMGAKTDLNEDGATDVADAALLMANYGRFGDVLSADAADQPEPTPQAVAVAVTPNPAFMAQQADGSAQVVVDTAGQPVWGLDLVLRFDPLVLRLDDVSELLAGHGAVPLAGNALDGDDGSLRYRIVLHEPISGTIPVLELSYQVVAQEATTTAWLIDAESQVVVVGQNLLAHRSDGHIGIRAANVLSLPQVFGRLSGLASAATDASALDGSVVQQAGAMSYPGAMSLPIVANVPVTQPAFEARDVRLGGNQAYLLQAPFFYERTHVRVLDISLPLMPRLLTEVNRPGSVREPDELWVEGARVVVANKCYGVDILDASDPATTRQVGNFKWAYPPVVNVKGVHSLGDRLYVADEVGLQIVDIAVPSRPSLMGVVKFEAGNGLGAFGEGVWAEGDAIYVAASYYSVTVGKGVERRPHVLIVDGTDPYHPRAVAHAVGPLPGRAVDVEVLGDTLYVAAENGGLLTFDVSDPREPVYLDGVATHLAQKVAVVANLVYVADDTGGLVVVDASDPADLVVVGVCDTPGRAFGVDASEGYAYVADGTGGMQVVSLAPLTPTVAPSATPTLTPTATPGPGPLLFPLILRGAAAR